MRFQPERVLLVGEHVAGIRDLIAAARPDLTLRMKRLAEIEAADLNWAEVYVGFRKPAVDGWGKIRWIHSIGAGVDGLVFRKPLPPGILLTKSGEDFGPAIGEWCVCRALAVNQRLTDLAADQAGHVWDRSKEPVVLRGQQVVILGTGAVGSGIARAFRALGSRVTGLSRSGAARPDFDAVSMMTGFAAAVRGADWLIVALPLTEDSIGLLSRDRLADCGGAYLMNVGRGAVIDEAAIPEALDRGSIRGAALDVFATEPLPADSPLWDHPKVVISPHNSGPSTTQATADGFLSSLESVERSETPWTVVDPNSGY